MDIQKSIEIIKQENSLMRLVQVNSPVWKKGILELLGRNDLRPDVKKAVIIAAGSMEDHDVINRLFSMFEMEKDDSFRRLIAESLKNNFSEKAVEIQMKYIGVKEKVSDRFVRQDLSQNITSAIKFYLEKKPIRAVQFITILKSVCLNDSNTFTRMNTAIILRNIGDKRVVPDLEKRLQAEKRILETQPGDVGVPYIINELERSISLLKERS